MASGPTVGVMTIALLWSVLATSPSSATMSRGAAWPAFEGGGLADATVLKPSKMGRNLSLLQSDTKPIKQCIKWVRYSNREMPAGRRHLRVKCMLELGAHICRLTRVATVKAVCECSWTKDTKQTRLLLLLLH